MDDVVSRIPAHEEPRLVDIHAIARWAPQGRRRHGVDVAPTRDAVAMNMRGVAAPQTQGPGEGWLQTAGSPFAFRRVILSDRGSSRPAGAEHSAPGRPAPGIRWWTPKVWASCPDWRRRQPAPASRRKPAPARTVLQRRGQTAADGRGTHSGEAPWRFASSGVVPAGWPVDDPTVGLVRGAEQRAK